MQLRIAGLVPESVVDGPGIRLVVFFQGCSHGCPGCHNPHTHDPAAGEAAETADILRQLAARPQLAGLTLSGGEPVEQAAAAGELALGAQSLGKNVLLYSGYSFEQLWQMQRRDAALANLLAATDILIDGPFIEAQRDLRLAFRGSANQRLLDLPASLQIGQPMPLA